MNLQRIIALATLVVATLGLPAGTRAQDYPTRTITLIVPYPPGGGVDTLARIVAEKLSGALKQQVVVDNRPTGGGNVGSRTVAKAAPDGYTLLLGHTGTISINPSLYANAGYDPKKDFAPIGLIADIPLVLMVNPAYPAKNVGELLEIARKNPDKTNLGSSAIGTGSYMCAELFKSMAGVNMTIIPYKGTAPLINDLVGNHVSVAFGVIPTALGNIQGGKLRALAVTGKTRSSVLPDVPTADSSGMPGFEAVLRYGLLAPAGTPKPIVDRLNKELRELVKNPDVIKRIQAEGGNPLSSTAEEYAADIVSEDTKWSTLIKKLNLKIEN